MMWGEAKVTFCVHGPVPPSRAEHPGAGSLPAAPCTAGASACSVACLQHLRVYVY